MKVDFDHFSDELVNGYKPKLSYDEKVDFESYKKELREKFVELLCIDKIKENACPLNVNIEWSKDKGDYTLTRFTVETEKNNFVPCYLLVPNTGKKTYPAIITLQGHTSGMHISIGEAHEDFEIERYFPDSCFALQAVENGYAAICIEDRGMGEQEAHQENRRWENGGKCKFAGFTALLLGRTLEGERVWDVSRVIDILPQFKELDLSNLMIMGTSGGGTLSYYAACYDERIKISIPSCAYCPYKESILAMYHCICNYIPHAYEWFDMQDLSALIAPRKLVICTGLLDPIFPIDGVRRGFVTTEAIYTKLGVKDRLMLVEMPKNHHFCPDYGWPAINEMFKR